VTVRVRDIDRYKRTVAEVILPDGRNLSSARGTALYRKTTLVYNVQLSFTI